MFDEILSVDDAAKYLKVKSTTIRRQAERGDLPGFKIGNRWRFRMKDIESFIDAQMNQEKFANRVFKLWEEIKTEVTNSEYSINNISEIIQEIRAKCSKKEASDAA
ncbi:MAG: helix-turn-helix domain-containing protein [bacterium]|jgi:excisionase family DNA binding protein|nr:helix-turn-helix domain-containing protein [bacterium]